MFAVRGSAARRCGSLAVQRVGGKSSIGALRFVAKLGELLRAMPGARGVDNFLFWDRRQ
jgi:hypothetical protein